MSSDLDAALGAMLARWTVGGAAAAAAPDGWRFQTDDAELRLLALAGQFLDAGVVAEPAGALRERPDLPRLALPTVAEPLRPLVRRALVQARDAGGRGDLLRLLERRGWSAHPGDWTPASTDVDAPALYAPWRDWAAGEADAGAVALTAETWGDRGPAGRRVAFGELRRRDPAAARDLLAAKLADLSADERVRLVELLGTGLSEADAPFLEALAADRGTRVKALAARHLARIGRGGSGSEEAAELAGFFAVATRGIIRRTRVLEPQPLKTHAQIDRRAALLAAVDLPSFARALGLAPAELAALWPWSGAGSPDALFAGMVERSGPDDAVVAALDGALAASAAWDALPPLAPRLSDADLARAAGRLLDVASGGLAAALDMTRARLDLDRAADTAAAGAVLAALARPDEARGRGEHEPELRALGLLASRSEARRTLDRMGQAGLPAADPRLATLRLNAALENSGAPDDR